MLREQIVGNLAENGGGRRMEPVRLHDGSDPVASHSLSPSELKQMLLAERVGEPFIAFRDDEGCLVLVRLDGAETRTVGRRPGLDVSLASDGEVSGLHAELVCVGGEWMIVDDGISTNGTYVNDERIVGRRRLRDGDRVRVGRTVLAYRAPVGSTAGTTVVAGGAQAPQRITDSQRRVLIALCRPLREGGSFATPATNQQIAAEVYLSVDAVKMHLRALFNRFELTELPQNQKRARLAECALQSGVISLRDLA
jgi:hypothetical protein